MSGLLLSLDEPAPGGDEEEELVYADLVEDPVATAFVQRAEDRQWIDWLLAGLDERSRRVLAWHFGHGLTYETIGKHEGVSRERVRQIVRDALRESAPVGGSVAGSSSHGTGRFVMNA